MQKNNFHIIGKQIFDLEYNQVENAYALEQEVSLVCRERLLPAMEKVFDEYVPAGQLVQLNRLELNIGEVGDDELSDRFVDLILKALREELSKLDIAPIRTKPIRVLPKFSNKNKQEKLR